MRILTLLGTALLVAAAAGDAQEERKASRTVWSGVYTVAQAARGNEIYHTYCSSCHGDDLEGIEGPTLSGEPFFRNWVEDNLSNLVSKIHTHEIRSGLAATVSYHHTDWRNQKVIVNQALNVSDYTPYCITAPADARLGATSGGQVCGLYDQIPAKFGQVSNVQMLAKDVDGAAGRPIERFNGVDMAINARFGNGGVAMGGVTLGRTMFDLCWMNALPNVTQLGVGGGAQGTTIPRTDGHCKLQSSLWNGVGSQIKFQVVYPLPYGLMAAGTFKHLPGIPITATYQASNLEARSTLGRDLSACRGLVGAACTARVPVELLPALSNSGNSAATAFDDRLNEVDVRLTKIVRVAGSRIQAIAELYNVFNNRPAQAIVNTYGSSWQLPTAILGGRLFKVGAQIDF